MSYDIGDSAKLTATFTNSASAAVDPTTVTLRVKSPDGTVATYIYGVDPITKTGSGLYEYDLALTAAGRYFYRWEGTGDAVAAEESSLLVNASAFP